MLYVNNISPNLEKKKMLNSISDRKMKIKITIFLVLTIVNSAAINIGVHVSFPIIIFSRCMPRSGMAESYSSSIYCFIRKLQTLFNSGCTNFHSHQQCRRVPFSLHPLQNVLFIDFFIIAILTGMR